MTKEQFLLALYKRLSALSRTEREERLTFYGEMIEDRMEEGLSEEEAVAAVGSADEIAGQILKEGEREQPSAKKKEGKGRKVALLAGAPLWICLLAGAFALWVSLWAGVISLWAGFAGLAGGSIGGLIGGVVSVVCDNTAGGIALIAADLVCVGLTIFMFMGCKAATKAMVWLTKKLVHWVKACFDGKEKTL